MPALLIVLVSLALSVGLLIGVLTVRGTRPRPKPAASRPLPPGWDATGFLRRPPCWLAIRSRSLPSVQAAFGLHNPKPCSWLRGLAGEEPVFIAPPVNGWVVVAGSGLPDPCEDPDRCFRFVRDLSQKLGHVQLFSANRALHSHAWVQAEGGCIKRAFAWAGHTLWKQGRRTSAESELNLQCPGYADAAEGFGIPEPMTLNAEKVPLLAAR